MGEAAAAGRCSARYEAFLPRSPGLCSACEDARQAGRGCSGTRCSCSRLLCAQLTDGDCDPCAALIAWWPGGLHFWHSRTASPCLIRSRCLYPNYLQSLRQEHRPPVKVGKGPQGHRAAGVTQLGGRRVAADAGLCRSPCPQQFKCFFSFVLRTLWQRGKGSSRCPSQGCCRAWPHLVSRSL